MRPLKSLSLLSLFFALLFIHPPAFAAADDVNDNEYDEHARVMRISLVKGEVSLQRAGNVEWERAKLNLPLVEGDTLATGRGARLEVQIDARNFVRIGEDSVIKVVTLRDEGIALSLTEGTATLRLARFDREHEYFEIDAPKTTMAAEQRGLYRLDVSRDGGVSVTVRDDGRARIYSESSGFVLRNNKTARLTYDGAEDGDWELHAAASPDGWDSWNDERDRFLASRLRYEGRDRYYDNEVWGAEELDAYGDWVSTSQYGYVWRPHVTVINNYNNWTPYRYGHWSWCPPYGWTWVADEEWGWAPYHYGRWVYYNDNWCWAPRGYGYTYHHSWWRPALVAFVYIPTSYGEHVAWYPLTYGQRDPRGRWWSRGYDRLSPLHARELANLQRANPALLRAVTTAPVREFGGESLRARPAANDIARRAVAGDPVRGRLPMTPSNDGRGGAPNGMSRAGGLPARGAASDSRAGLNIVRPTPVRPPRDVPERPTGAAARTPGVQLDDMLRRERIFNGREPRLNGAVDGTGGTGGDRSIDVGTGAVTRPVRTNRRSPADDAGAGVNRNSADSAPVPRTRPVRPMPSEDAGRAGPDTTNERRVRMPPSRDHDKTESPRVRTVRPPEDSASPPPISERPEPRVRRTEPDERPQPPPRREEPPVRQEQPRQEQPRQEPPARQERQAAPPERPAPSAPPARSSEPHERPAAPARPPSDRNKGEDQP